MFQHTRLFKAYIQQRKAKTLAELSAVMKLDWLDTKDYRIINTMEGLEWAISCIEKAPIIGVDTETTGLNICNLSNDNPLKDKIVGMSISWERNQGIYIPFEHVCFTNLDKSVALTRLKPYLESKSIVTHNGLFDGKVFYDEGIRLNITQDTMLMYFNMDSTVSKGSKGLKALTTRKYGYEVIELSDIFESESDAGLFQYVEYELVKAYACADSDHTLMLFMDSFMDLLPGQIKSYRLDVRVQNELVRSEYFGKGVDMDLLKKLSAINSEDIQTLEYLIYSYVGGSLAVKHGLDPAGNMYRFNIASSQDLVDILFNKMGYEIPIGLRSKDKLSVDKYTLRALMDIPSKGEDLAFESISLPQIVERDGKQVLISSDGESVLLKWSDLRTKGCKLAHMITKCRKLEKLRSSFFAPLIQNNYEGKYFSSIKMTRAETARLVDFIQTLDASLKKLIVPLERDKKPQYLLDFDFAQIEYRVMAGEAGVTSVVEKLENPEADYHREGGSLILGKAPEDITNSERKSLKSINFGIPYGMSSRGILQSRYGIGLTEEETKEHLAEIEQMLKQWDSGLHQIAVMLNSYRDKACTPVSDATLPPHLRGRTMGRIANIMGRTRLFNLEDMTSQKRGSIRRQAGNYPIQSFAREVYCVAFCDFCDACKREGLMDVLVPDETKATGYRFENKVNIMAYIHDECLMSVDGDVNHEFLYKLIYENCMKKIKGYPRFYCGINVINNWYEGKDDKFEAPIGYVEECIKQNPPKLVPWDTDHKSLALDGITRYMIRRIDQELVSIDPRTSDGVFDLPYLVPRFKNYFVKPKVAAYIGLCAKPDDSKGWDDFGVVSIESFALYKFKDSTLRDMNGNIIHLARDSEEYKPKAGFIYEQLKEDSEEYRQWVTEYMDTAEGAFSEDDSVSALDETSETISKEVIDILNQEFIPDAEVSWSFKE